MSDNEHSREAKTTMLGVKVPRELRERIKAAAKITGHTESSFARLHLTHAAESIMGATEEAAR